MTVAAIVPAAGRGDRLGPGPPKALRPVGGVPMLVHAVRALSDARSVSAVVVAAPVDEVDSVTGVLSDFAFASGTRVVAGGACRQESVALALAALDGDVDIVLVHDAARPFVPAEVVERVVAAVAAGHGAVIPVVPLADTVKEVDADGSVVATPDRSRLLAVQTPQGFDRVLLARAHAAADGADAPDDAWLVERLGVRVHTVPGSPESFKVTRPIDLTLAEALLAARRRSGVR